MIDFEKLYNANRVVVSFIDVAVDGAYVKRFRKENGLTQIALANIMGVSKKAIEKWEQGVNKVSGSSAVLITLLNNNKDLLKQVYSVKIINNSNVDEYVTFASFSSTDNAVWGKENTINSLRTFSPKKLVTIGGAW